VYNDPEGHPMRLLDCLNALEEQHRLIAQQVMIKSRQIYEEKYLDEYNIVAFHAMNAVHKVRTVCFIFVQNNPTTGDNQYFTTVMTTSPVGISRQFWIDDELVDTYTDNSLPLFTFIGAVNLVKTVYSDLVAANDYPSTIYKVFVEGVVQAENEFLFMTGIPFAFMSGQQMKLMRAL
jgi:hypothetical protein